MSDLYISKRPWNYKGDQIEPGEVMEPTGSLRDHLLFGDNTHWVTRLIPMNGTEPILCDSDGCQKRFVSLGALQRHRDLVHRPEREDRARFQREHRETIEARERRGETIGGYEVSKTISGPGGPVPYVKI